MIEDAMADGDAAGDAKQTCCSVASRQQLIERVKPLQMLPSGGDKLQVLCSAVPGVVCRG